MDRERKLFVEGYLDDRYRRGERPDMREPRGRGLPDAKGRVMAVVSCYAGARPSTEPRLPRG